MFVLHRSIGLGLHCICVSMLIVIVDMILFESGYGDAALAWEQVDVLSATDYTKVFSSNFYYHSTEIENLVKYVKAQKGELVIQGFDCQPQQNYLIQRMAKIVLPIDSVMAKSALSEMRGFNQLHDDIIPPSGSFTHG